MNLESKPSGTGVASHETLPPPLLKIIENEKQATSSSIRRKMGLVGRGFLAMTILAGAQVGLAPRVNAQETQKPGVNQTEQNLQKFEKITAAYKIFDDSSPEKINEQLALYEQNRNILASLPPWEQAEFLHQWSFVRYSAIKLKYGVKPDAQFLTPTVDALDVYKKDIPKDSETLRDAYNQLEKSLNTALLDSKLAEDKSKVERVQNRASLKRQERFFLNSINGATTEGVLSKETAIAKLRSGVHKFTKGSVNFVGTLELKSSISGGSVKFQIKFVGDEGTEFVSVGLITFDVIDGKTRVTHTTGDYVTEKIESLAPTKEELEAMINPSN